ncbi:MAG: hypothetical protein E7256_18070 [Lachnospiraceae bacterium]|nr:hypothetical protein [Lachnospiraceae bacterium]
MKKQFIFKFVLIFGIVLFLTPVTTIYAAARTDKVVNASVGDTSTELQALLDYNKNGDYNLTVEIPAGTYELTAELRIYSNTTIIADPKAHFVKNHLRGAMIANDMKNDKGGYTTSTNITIQGGIWDSAKIAAIKKGTESFRFIHATNVTIKNATICNVPESSHLITFAGVKNGTVDQCTIYGYTGTRLKEAIHLDVVHDDELVPSMQSTYITYDDLPCDGIRITNNEIYDYPRAIGSHSAVDGVYHKNITISSNNIHDIAEAGIKAYQYVNLTIENNKLTNTGLGILAYTYIANEEDHYYPALKTTKKEKTPANYQIVIKNNEINTVKFYTSGKNTLWGDGIRLIGSAKRPLTGSIIEGNTITGTKRYGIFLEQTPNTKVLNNIITSTSKNGIYLINGCNKSTIQGNKVSKAGAKGSEEGGIGISKSSKVTIANNNVTNAAKNGIFLYNTSNSCVIKSNTIKGAADNAISVNNNSNNAVITANTITGSPTSKRNNRGIFVYKANNATISKNIISKCKAKQEININNSTGSKLSANTIKK